MSKVVQRIAITAGAVLVLTVGVAAWFCSYSMQQLQAIPKDEVEKFAHQATGQHLAKAGFGRDIHILSITPGTKLVNGLLQVEVLASGKDGAEKVKVFKTCYDLGMEFGFSATNKSEKLFVAKSLDLPSPR